MADKHEVLKSLNFDPKTSELLNKFWIGFIIHSAGFTLSATTVVNYATCQVLQILGIILFFTSAVKLIRWKFHNTYLKILFSLYCCWSFITIIRVYSFEYEDIKNKLFDVDGIFRFFVPLIFLFPKDIIYYKKLFKAIVAVSIIFIIYDIVFYKNLMNLNYENNDTKFTFEHFLKVLGLPSGFILLTFVYHQNKRKFLSVITIGLGVVFSIFRARRALLFMSLSPMVISLMLYLYKSKQKFIIIFLSICLSVSLFLYGAEVFTSFRDGVFSLLNERLSEDTRTNVEECFYEDMNFQDWIIGKGIDGQYFCPNVDLNDTTGYRSMIETDYLNIILKGGILSLVLILLILIPAIVKGLFYSHNFLSKAAAIWILLWVLALYPATVYSFSLNHVLVWVSAGICYSQAIRGMPEDSVKM
ncbi:MAG: hypothetical protein EOO43_06205, partial [Flavobacterium sp.]